MEDGEELYIPFNKPVLNLFTLTGKTAIVTGGAGGIGFEVVRALAEAGANVALLYNSSSDAHDKAKTVAGENSVKCLAYQANLIDSTSVNDVFEQVLKDYGRLDIVVANAGICASSPAESCLPSQFNQIMNTNVNTVMYCAQAGANAFKKQGFKSGSIIFTASVSARLVNIPQKQAAYNASKAAVVHLAQSLAVEWTGFCRVNCVSPGYIETELLKIHPEDVRSRWKSLVPAKRNACPYELKGVFVFLASEASSYMTGADLVVDGGYSLI